MPWPLICFVTDTIYRIRRTLTDNCSRTQYVESMHVAFQAWCLSSTTLTSNFISLHASYTPDDRAGTHINHSSAINDNQSVQTSIEICMIPLNPSDYQTGHFTWYEPSLRYLRCSRYLRDTLFPDIVSHLGRSQPSQWLE